MIARTPPLSDVPHSTAALDRRAASRDLWPAGTLAMWQGDVAPWPARVYWPRHERDLLAIVAAAAEEDVVLVPYGAGSGVCGGARGRAGSWVIDTKRLDRIGEVDPETWTVEVEAGVNGQQLEDHLAAAGWTLGHSPSSIGCSTVGGWAAARGAGQFSSRYGVFEDMVLGVDAVAPGIGAFHVGLPGPSSPRRREPDALLDLLLGSEGTLGVLTRFRLRVRPLPDRRWLRGYRMPSLDAAIDAMRALMQAELWPSVVRLYDPVDTFIGGKTKPGKAQPAASEAGGTRAWWARWLDQVDALPPLRRRTLALPLSLPGVLQGVADVLSGGCLLIVGFEGRADVVEASVEAATPLLASRGDDLGPEPGERWYASRHHVSYKLMPVFERGGFADTMEVAAPWSRLRPIYDAVRAAVRPHALVMCHLSHLYPEGGSLYFSFAGRGDRAVYDRVWSAAQEAVLSAGGTTTHHHGVGLLKARWASREVGPAVAGWTEARARLDPDGRCNPGTVFTDVPLDPPPDVDEQRGDGLIRLSRTAGPDARRRLAAEAHGEILWPWDDAAGPPRAQREPWQSAWIAVRGRVALPDGQEVACHLGRGPRSAAGPDLRRWLADRGRDVEVTVGLAPDGPRWMGEGRPAHPWRVAQDLLRGDLRPAVLAVVDGVLRVGFRGPAADAYGALAAARVPGGLTPCDYRPVPLPARRLRPCDVDDPNVVHVTTEHAWRPLD